MAQRLRWGVVEVVAVAGQRPRKRRPERVVGKVKLSQDKPAADVASVIVALDPDPTHANPTHANPTHANPALAEAMRRQHAAPPKG
ncbi:hypothetical protein [Micromonospora sp. CPCC 206061]|uniref:hypothetical protein n=1 Tax=Micromonospora sp. CPCC 206061 TaxID=3122410 RepID=UPI002FF264DF